MVRVEKHFQCFNVKPKQEHTDTHARTIASIIVLMVFRGLRGWTGFFFVSKQLKYCEHANVTLLGLC